MNKPTVYIVSGVSGSGKSWICSHLKDDVSWVDGDSLSYQEALNIFKTNKGPFIYDPYTNVSTFIKRNKDILDIKLLVILGDYLEVKSNLKNRVGNSWRYSKSFKSRWNRMLNLASQAEYSGSSIEVLKYLRTHLKTKTHLVYKATSPSGKIYIGKTSIPLSHRISCHIYDATVRQKTWAFSSAIRKYGDSIVWEIVEDNLSAEAASSLEKLYINLYNTTNPNFGYNISTGGDGGGRLTGEALMKKQLSLKKFYSSSDGLLLRDKLRQSSLAMRKSDTSDLINKKVKQRRSSTESRLKTSNANKVRFKDTSQREKLSAINKDIYSDPSVRRRVALAVRAARARKFQVWNPDGVLLGVWDSATTCAEELSLNRSCIGSCLHNRSPSHKGYTFKYLDQSTMDTHNLNPNQ